MKRVFYMVFGVFSTDPKNMRWFNLKRLLITVLIIPFFMVNLVINNVFLLLDYVIFPRFTRQKVTKPVFIIAPPRCATTFMYHSLVESKKYTCFRLWEILFAPAICQKYFYHQLFKLDKLFNHPLQRFALKLEKLFFGEFKKIHLMGLNMPEEDELILIWNLSGLYLHFYYPDSTFFDDLLFFDESLPLKERKKIMGHYFKQVQRHNYFYNRQNKLQFISKNPLMMPKISTLYDFFSDALLVNIYRDPSTSFPSTLSLNKNIYKLFTSKPMPSTLRQKTIDTLVRWQNMAFLHLVEKFPNQHVYIDYQKFIGHDQKELMRLATFLDINSTWLQKNNNQSANHHKSYHKYNPLSESELNSILLRLPTIENK